MSSLFRQVVKNCLKVPLSGLELPMANALWNSQKNVFTNCRTTLTDNDSSLAISQSPGDQGPLRTRCYSLKPRTRYHHSHCPFYDDWHYCNDEIPGHPAAIVCEVEPKLSQFSTTWNSKSMQIIQAQPYLHGMLCVSRPEGAEADGKRGETEDDEDASIKLPIPAINFYHISIDI